jgi:hypothetical protein
MQTRLGENYASSADDGQPQRLPRLPQGEDEVLAEQFEDVHLRAMSSEIAGLCLSRAPPWPQAGSEVEVSRACEHCLCD